MIDQKEEMLKTLQSAGVFIGEVFPSLIYDS